MPSGRTELRVFKWNRCGKIGRNILPCLDVIREQFGGRPEEARVNYLRDPLSTKELYRRMVYIRGIGVEK